MKAFLDINKDFANGDHYSFALKLEDGKRLVAVETSSFAGKALATIYTGNSIRVVSVEKAEGFRDGAGFDWHCQFIDEDDHERIQDEYREDRRAFRALLEWAILFQG